MKQSIAGTQVDLLTAGELSHHLHENLGERFHSRWEQERLRGLKLVRLPLISQQAGAATFTLGEQSGGVPCGPESGYIWRVSRLLITSSQGYFQSGGAASSSIGPGAGVSDPAAGAQILTLGTLAAGVYTLQWTVSLTVAATVANNFAVKVGGVQVAQSINGTATGNYPQQTITFTVPSGGATVTLNAILLDATGTYNGQLTATPTLVAVGGGGDSAIVSGLYCASDQSATQRSLVDQVGINLGVAYMPGTRGLIVKSGEQLMATIQGATIGNTYELSGIATEVPTIMQGKVID